MPEQVPGKGTGPNYMRDQNEISWDRLLKIHTSGRDDTGADQNHYPYEPTPYCVLERLAASGYISRDNTVVDYGCGKGRVDFYLAYQIRCSCIGVEYDQRIFLDALANQQTSVSGHRTEFLRRSAERFIPPEKADRFYFFNPFSMKLFRKVFGRLKKHYYRTHRELLLFFYYPSDEYLSFLMAERELSFLDEINCRDLFEEHDSRETIMVFRMGG